MSYYTGQGDYYSGKGDPGLFGFLGGVAKSALGVAGTVLPGPLGGIARLGRSLLGGRAQQAPVTRAVTPPPPIRMPQGMTPRIGVAPAVIAAGPVTTNGTGGACGPGWHLNKQRSYAKGAEAGTMCVRNRSMNPGNAKALRRAIRREKAFIGLARSALKGTGWRMTKSSARTKRRGGRHRH